MAYAENLLQQIRQAESSKVKIYEDTLTLDDTGAVRPFTLSAIGFTAKTLHLSIEDNNVRYRYGGSSPTTTSGHPFYAGLDYVFDNKEDISEMRLIAVKGAAIVQFTAKG